MRSTKYVARTFFFNYYFVERSVDVMQTFL